MEKLFILAVSLALFLNAEANVDESIQLRIFNPDFRGMSVGELETLIEEADLPSLGYKKITETKTETDFETGLPVYQEAVRYLKKMPCNKVPKAVEMLQILFPGALGDDVAEKSKSEIENRHLENSPSCIIGVEFHLKGCQYRSRQRRRISDKKGDKPDCSCSGTCIVIKNEGKKSLSQG